MSIPSNFTNREAFRVFDPLLVAAFAPERIEGLLAVEDQAADLSADSVNEAIANYPDEDCLEEILAKVLELKDASVAELPAKIDALAEIVMAREKHLVEAGEYGREQLEKLADQLENLTA